MVRCERRRLLEQSELFEHLIDIFVRCVCSSNYYYYYYYYYYTSCLFEACKPPAARTIIKVSMRNAQ